MIILIKQYIIHNKTSNYTGSVKKKKIMKAFPFLDNSWWNLLPFWTLTEIIIIPALKKRVSYYFAILYFLCIHVFGSLRNDLFPLNKLFNHPSLFNV